VESWSQSFLLIQIGSYLPADYPGHDEAIKLAGKIRRSINLQREAQLLQRAVWKKDPIVFFLSAVGFFL